MTSLLTIRDEIKGFFSDHDVIVTPIFRFVIAFILLLEINALYGYSDMFSKPPIFFAICAICAFMSEGVILLIIGAVTLVHCFSVGLEVAAIYAVLFMVMYFMYIKFFPKTGYIVLFTPLLYMFKMHYLLPIIVGIVCGPAGIISAIFGVIFYYFSQYVHTIYGYIQGAAEGEKVSSFMYIFTEMPKDKAMLLTMIVFACIIMITYIIYRLSARNSWYIAIFTGGVLEFFLFLMGGYALEADIDITTILVGTLVGIFLSFVFQFFKGTVDYTRTEIVQFEDDEYYYYVKAVPKLTVAAKNVNVKTINQRKN